MKHAELNALAKKHGFAPGQHSISEVIKSIQSKEGNFDCFATAINGECDQGGCSWRADCFDTAAAGTPSIV